MRYFDGNKAAVAAHFGKTSTECVRIWGRSGIPPRYALECERLSNGAIKAMDVLTDFESVRTKIKRKIKGA